MYSYVAFLRINSVKMQQRRGKYIVYIYLLLHLLYREKQDFLRFFERGKRKEKFAPKEKRKPAKNFLFVGFLVNLRKWSEPLSFLSLVHRSLIFVDIDNFEHYH